MSLEVARYAEGSLAVFALVGLFAGVGSKMSREIGRPWEDLSAKFTGVAVLHLPVGVIMMMGNHSVWIGIDGGESA